MLKQVTMVPNFTHEDARIRELLNCMHETADLSALGALAEWDQNTAMPEGAGEVRGDQMATLQGVLHERWTAPRLGKLLETRLGAEVVYTRKDDSYVALERRAEIANQERAELFLSVHANYSDLPISHRPI